MHQPTQVQCGVCNVGLCLTALLCLWLAMSASARADAFDNGIGNGNHSLRPIATRSENGTGVIVCGGQTGGVTSLEISGANVATLWRMTYRMLFPRSALADQPKTEPIAPLPDKGPTWNISVSHGKAQLSIQTKW